MAGNSRLNRYSLADYQLTVTFDTSVISGTSGESTIVIGGVGQNNMGSYVGDITVKRTTDLWKTEGDATGSWVHNKDLNRTGTIDVEITQVSDQVVQLVYLCTAYESVSDAVEGLQLIITNTASEKTIATAIDCYIAKIPDKLSSSEKVRWILKHIKN